MILTCQTKTWQGALGTHRHLLPERVEQELRNLRKLGEFGYRFRTKTCQQGALGIHRHLLQERVEQELRNLRHLGGFGYTYQTNSWSKRQEDRHRHHHRHRQRHLPFEYSIPTPFTETSR